MQIVNLFLMTMPVAYGSSQASRSCRLMPQLWPHQIQAPSVTCIAAFSNTGSLTHWARPGIKPASSWRQHHVLNPLSHSGNSTYSNFNEWSNVLFFLWVFKINQILTFESLYCLFTWAKSSLDWKKICQNAYIKT